MIFPALLASALAFVVAQAATAPVPQNTAPVVDTAGAMDAGTRDSLNQALLQFQKQHGSQLQALIVPSLDGDTIENYSIRAAERWGTGDRKRDDGVLLVVAVKDRKLRIEVGQGLEGTLPDVIAGRIVRDVIAPRFKTGDLSGGVVAGMQSIARRLGGELAMAQAPPPRYADSRPGMAGDGPSGFTSLLPLLVLFFFVLPALFRRRQSRGLFGMGRARSSGLGNVASGFLLGSLLGGRRRSSGWGGGGGGGGIFGGGGGGGFSGGGASGDW